MQYILAFIRFLDLAYKASIWVLIVMLFMAGGLFYRNIQDEDKAIAAGDKAFWECHNPGEPELHLPTCKFDNGD